MTALPCNYDVWRLQGPPEPRFWTEWDDTAQQWMAWDDRIGVDDSPIGTGQSEQDAIDDLLAQLE